MNYLAHGWRHVHDPYFLAGTAVPDWLNVADRKVRVRRRPAESLADDADPRVSRVARGIVQHHRDDAWFHATPAFAELSLAFSRRLSGLLADAEGMRPYFLGHILVEILLDAALIDEQPVRLADYYDSLAGVDPEVVESVVNRIAPRPTQRLALLVPRFLAERFLPDYLDDAKLMVRLNQVLRRVGLPQLPLRAAELFAEARRRVAERKNELLPREYFELAA